MKKRPDETGLQGRQLRVSVTFSPDMIWENRYRELLAATAAGIRWNETQRKARRRRRGTYTKTNCLYFVYLSSSSDFFSFYFQYCFCFLAFYQKNSLDPSNCTSSGTILISLNQAYAEKNLEQGRKNKNKKKKYTSENPTSVKKIQCQPRAPPIYKTEREQWITDSNVVAVGLIIKKTVSDP